MMMMMSWILLAVLFIFGLVNSLIYLPPRKFLGWVQSFLPKSAISSVMSTTTSMATKEKKKGVHDKVELERVFATFDKNGDGFITRQELGESLKNMRLFTTDKEVAEMVERVDSNGDGLIDLEEFCELYESMGRREEGGSKDGEMGLKEEVSEEDLKEAFDVFDGNGDGLISVDELGSVLSSMGLKQGMRIDDCKEMIRKVDMDGDGMVSFEEFKKMMKVGASLVTHS